MIFTLHHKAHPILYCAKATYLKQWNIKAESEKNEQVCQATQSSAVSLPSKRRKFRTKTIQWDRGGDIIMLKNTAHNKKNNEYLCVKSCSNNIYEAEIREENK